MIKRILLFCCITLASHAQRPLRWVADAVTTAPVTFDCSRGETLTFAPVLKAYGTTLTNYTASFQWQTNGMGTAFWSTNVLAFTPSMDCGASRYRFFIRAEATNGILYSAQGTINMLHAPGATVNALPIPVPSLNFDAIVYTNAPWLLAELDPGIPGAIDTAVESAVAIAGTNAQGFASAALSNAVAFASTNRITRIFNPTNSYEYIDGAGSRYTITPMWELTFSPDFRDSQDRTPNNTSYSISATGDISEFPFSIYWTSNVLLVQSQITGIYFSGWWATTNSLVLNPMQGGARGYAYVRSYSVTNLVGTLAMESSVTASLATKVSTNDATYLSTVSKATTAVQPAALSSYLPLTGGTMSGYGASITFSDLYATFTYSSSGIAVVSPPFGINALYKYPAGITGTVDANGEFYLATRTWAESVLYPRNNPSNYIALAQVPAETDTAAKALIATETNRAIQAEALLYPASNPSSYITLAQVPAETDTAALAAIATETNRAIQAEALLYPASNPSSYITLGQVPAETDTAALAAIATETNRAIQAEALLYPASNPSSYITLAQVPAETDTAALAAIATETNRAIQAEALLYPASNPSNYTDAESVTNISVSLVSARAPFQVFSNLTASVTLTNQLEAPISIIGTGAVSVAFSGLVSPYPLYFTAQGFTSLTFPAGTYLVGGGMWQTNRVNHFTVWLHSTNLYVNPLISTEIVP